MTAVPATELSKTSLAEDPKAQKKLLRKRWKEPVDVTKVNTDVLKKWISDEIQKILPDDDIAREFIIELIVGAENGSPDIKSIREQLNDFVGKEESDHFCLELWELLLNAQCNPEGLPTKLLEEHAKMAEKQAELNARRQANEIILLIRSADKIRKSPGKEFNRISKQSRSNRKHKPQKPKAKTNYNRS